MLTDEQPPLIAACESALSAWVHDPIHRAQHSERALAFLDDPSTIRRYVRHFSLFSAEDTQVQALLPISRLFYAFPSPPPTPT